MEPGYIYMADKHDKTFFVCFNSSETMEKFPKAVYFSVKPSPGGEIYFSSSIVLWNEIEWRVAVTKWFRGWDLP
jgi:hypothetical protein